MWFVVYISVLIACIDTANSACAVSKGSLDNVIAQPYFGSALLKSSEAIYIDSSDLNLPNTNTQQRYCFWRVNTPTTAVKITFLEFDLRDDVACDTEFMSLVLTDGKQPDMKYCGKSYPREISLLTFSIRIHFQTDSYGSGSKFKLKIEPQEVTDICTSTQQLIATPTPSYLYSPGYPLKYYSSLDCKWQIRNPNSDEVIMLYFEKFDIESASTCNYDNLTITGEKTNIVKCGLQDTFLLKIEEDSISLNFSTDVYTQKSGFVLRYYTVPKYNGHCDVSSTFDLISTRGQPRVVTVERSNDKTCTWKLAADNPSDVIVFELLSYADVQLLCHLKLGIYEQNKKLGLYTCMDSTVRYYRSATDKVEVTMEDQPWGFTTVNGSLSFSFYSMPKGVFTDEVISVGNTPNYIFVSSQFGENYQPSFVFKNRTTGCIEVEVLSANRSSIARLTDYYEFFDGPDDKSVDVGNACYGLIDSLIGTQNYMFIRKKRGQYLHVGTWLKVKLIGSCVGNVIDIKVGHDITEIKSPNYPLPFRKNQVCRWRVKKFSYFDDSIIILSTQPMLNDTRAPKPCIDNLAIADLDEYGKKAISNWCLDSEDRYILDDTYTYLTFRASKYDSNINRSFKLLLTLKNSSLKRCQSYSNIAMVNEVKYLMSPFYPEHYTNKLDCTWDIQAKDYHKINITVETVDLPDSGRYDCGDVLSIYKSYGIDGSSRVKEYCTSIQKPESVITKNIARVYFKTNREKVAKGFKLSYSAIDLSGDCNEDFTVDINPQYLSSNNYPDTYDRGFKCYYRLNKNSQFSNNYRVTIEFIDYQLPITNYETGSGVCNIDYLVIYDGRDSAKDKQLGTICGTKSGQVIDKFTALSYNMLLSFITQDTASGRYRGFKIKYYLSENTEGACYPGFPLKLQASATPRYISSPNYPSDYDNDQYCQWRITCTNNKVIAFEVLDFKLGEWAVNDRDTVNIFDGKDRYAIKIGTLQGLKQDYQLIFKSTGCHIFVEFSSNSMNTYAGFRVKFYETDYAGGFTPSSEVSVSKTGMLIGLATAGSFVCICVIVVCICCCCRRRKSSEETAETRHAVRNNIYNNTTTNTVYVVSPNSPNNPNTPPPYPGIPATASAPSYSLDDLPPPYQAPTITSPPHWSGLPNYEDAIKYEIPNSRSPLQSLGSINDEPTTQQPSRDDLVMRRPNRQFPPMAVVGIDTSTTITTEAENGISQTTV